MSQNVWVVLESRGGVVADAGLGVLAEAGRLAAATEGTAVAVVIADDVDAVATQAAAAGAGQVLTVQGPQYRDYSTEAFTHAVVTLVRAHEPSAVLFAATTQGSDLAPRVAARLGTTVVTDCVALRRDQDGRITFTKSAFGGGMVTRCVVRAGIQIATVRTGVLPKAESVPPTAEVLTQEVPPLTQPVRTTLVEHVAMDSGGEVPIEEADVVVAGGRAMGSAERFAVLRDLADAFGPTAAVGASRPAADAGWVPTQLEIGVSGKSVSPDLYVACGISGASQHLAGMSASRVVVAINEDPEAPIFARADLGVVGDLFEIVPALARAVRERRG